MKIAVVMLLFLATASPVSAGSTGASRSPPSTITCETVRAYVSLLGLAQAKAMARANGMTAVQERRAMQCLARAD
jgi:sulfur transfer protein SufE